MKAEGVPPVTPAKVILRFNGRGNSLRRRVVGKRDAKSVTLIIGLGPGAKQGWVIFAPAPQGGMEVTYSKDRPPKKFGDFDTELALTNLDDLKLARVMTGIKLPISLRRLHKIMVAADITALPKPGLLRRTFGTAKVEDPTPSKIGAALRWLMAPPKKTAKP